MFYRTAWLLASARLRQHQPGQAIDLLQRALAVPIEGLLLNGETLDATMLQFRLAGLYRYVGRVVDADTLERQALRGLEHADAAFLRQMRELAAQGLGGIDLSLPSN
jgi:hypothetical protein